MQGYRSIYIEKGEGGFGGPLVITPTDQRNKVMYIMGEVEKPECLDKIVELSGMTPVDGYKETCPEDELGLVIVDCGGTLRCGIYPKKRIPTINVMPVGAAGPLADFIVPDIYASSVGPDQVRLASPEEVNSIEKTRLDKDAAAKAPAKPKEEEDDSEDNGGMLGKLFGK